MSRKINEKNNSREKWGRTVISAAAVAIGTIAAYFFIISEEAATDSAVTDPQSGAVQVSTENNSSLEEQNQLAEEMSKLETVLKEMRPALTALQDTGGNTKGSGFILALQDDLIYICTNRHVIEDYEDWKVTFHDGTIAGGKKEGVSQTYDVGMISVKTEDIPESLLGQLSVVNIDLDYWKELDGQLLDVGFVSMYQDETADKFVTGLLLDPLADFPWGNRLRHSEFQLKFVNGDSGSAIFDETGHLISMICGTSYEDQTGRPRRWGIPLSGIMSCYTEIVNRNLLSDQ